MFYVTRESESIGGMMYLQDLMEHQENGKVYFRSSFETHGFKTLCFKNEKEMFDYFDEKMPENKFVIYDRDILYPLNEGDRTLCYFGSIKYDESYLEQI